MHGLYNVKFVTWNLCKAEWSRGLTNTMNYGLAAGWISIQYWGAGFALFSIINFGCGFIAVDQLNGAKVLMTCTT
jgi:hypothetical protein